MADNEVVIEVSADTKAAQQGFKDVQSKISPLKGQVEGLRTGFAQFGKAMGIVGLGGLSLGMVLRGVTQTTTALQRQVAFSEFALAQLGPEFVKGLEEARPYFSMFQKDFAFTAADAEKAYGIISSTSRQAGISLERVADAMAVARISGADLATASSAVGQAMLGNIMPMNSLVGLEQDLVVAHQDLVRRGKEATTVFQSIGARGKQAFQDIVEDILPVFDLIDSLMANVNIIKFGFENILPIGFPVLRVIDFISEGTHKVVIDAIGSFFTTTIPSWWEELKAFPGKTIDFIWGMMPEGLPWWWPLLKRLVKLPIKFVFGAMPEGLPWWWPLLKRLVKLPIKFVFGAMPEWGDGPWWWPLLKRLATVSIKFILGPMPTIPRSWIDKIGQAFRPDLDLDFGGGKRAMGGPASGLTLVGERGPELVRLPGGSNVIPNHRLAPALAGAGGTTINVNVYNPVVNDEISKRSLARQIKALISEDNRRGIGI